MVICKKQYFKIIDSEEHVNDSIFKKQTGKRGRNKKANPEDDF